MGRNRKLGLEYFPLDVDIINDIKIRKLIKYQGGKAFTVYAILLCIIYRNGYYLEWDKELPFILSELTGFDEAFIQEVINCCMTLGLFDTSTFQKHQVITSRGIQERYQWVCRNGRRVNDVEEYNLLASEEAPVTDTTMELNVTTGEEQIKQEMLNSPIWMEQMCMRHHYDAEKIIKLIDEFFLDCACREKTHTSLQDAKRHFNDWLTRMAATINQAQTRRNNERNRRTIKTVDAPEAFKGTF